MSSRHDIGRSKRSGGAWVRLLAFVLLLGAAAGARAEDCSDYPGGVLDGAAGTPAPSNLSINRNCTIRNYPGGMSTNFSFYTQPGQTDQRWLVIFDNVVHTGQMACDAVHEHRIWLVNGSSTGIHASCQNWLIPVEKIDKKNPAGQTTATIGVPFTYTLTMPVLYAPATNVVIDWAGSPNDLHSVTLTDDLNATGADLTYLGHVAYIQGTNTPVPHTFTNADGVLTFGDFPIIPAGQQIIIEVTVVLEDTPANVVGTTFVNTAKWYFGRLIEGTFYEPLPGEWGISPPLTIAAPQLVVTKTGPATLNLGQWGTYSLDVQNTGLTDAWNAALLDRLPDGATGGLCTQTPELLNAQVFAADGVTPVPGKGPLLAGTDYSTSFTGAPTCELRFTALTAKAVIGAGQRLVVQYRSRLDADTQNGVALTNVAGAVEWFNGDAGTATRVPYRRTLTNGTPATADHEDDHTVTVAFVGDFFEKTVANLTRGTSPATTAQPGDRLRYSLRLRSTGGLPGFTLRDELDALNATAAFVPGTLSLVGTLPAGAMNNTNPAGGAKGTGLIDLGNLSLAAGGELLLQFDVTLASALVEDTVVANQAAVRIGGATHALSDDPNVNGMADPTVPGDEDPTRITITLPMPSALAKANTQATAAVGEVFRYRITVPATPFPHPLYDVRIADDLTASAADLRFVSVTKIAGSQPWTPVNLGTATSLVIADPTVGIDIPAGEQVVVEVAVQLENTATNVAGLQFTNTASYLFNRLNGNATTQRPGGPGTSPPMTIVAPDQLTLEKSGPTDMGVGVPATFTLDVHNPSTGTAWGMTLTDRLPDTATGGMCETAPSQVTAQRFQADGVTAASPPLTQGTDYGVTFSGEPACTLTLRALTPAAALGAGQHLVVTYQAQLDVDTQNGVALTNVAGATEWFSADPSVAAAAGQVVTYTRSLTDGTVGVLDHQDAHTTLVLRPTMRFDKTVANLTSGANPAAVARPGDTLRYTLRVENLSDVPLTGFALRDELDRLNATAAFAGGTLAFVTVPTGADVSNTNPTGGARGTGLLDVRNLTLPPSGGTVTVVFDVRLAPVIANGSVVANQSSLNVNDATLALSDDPNVNGPSDPDVPNDDDLTRLTIESAPSFVVHKVSTDLTGDPNVLLAGETLRYTITVRNVGTDDAAGVTLRDQMPVNTQYVAGSTTLNGAAVPDVGGWSALVNGLQIQPSAATTAGAMPAGPVDSAAHLATITFDVVVDPSVVDGTVISNQGFVSALAAGIVERPSDDPATPTVDDPTRDIVGALPLLYADKRVVLQSDQGSPGVVDPGDVLRYTITVTNSASTPATGVVLTDAVPANTAYVANTTTLNGAAYGQPDGGTSPLVSGISLGTLASGATAVVRFDLRVDAGTPAGTVISNQAVVRSVELPGLLTDGDGNPATGPEPTVVVVGDGQQLTITKDVAVVGGGAAVAGATLEYVVRVTNVAAVPAQTVVLSDDFAGAPAGRLTFVAGSATLDGSTAGVSYTGSVLTANYGAGALAPGASAVLRFRAVLGAGLASGTTVTNTAVVTWNTPTQTASASVSIGVGGVPGVGVFNGAAWHDANFDDVQDSTERALVGWTVDLYRDEQAVASVAVDATGSYRLSGLSPNDATGTRYELRLRAPGAGARTALLGRAVSPFTNGLQRIADIVVTSGANLQGLNLPIEPNGVVYNSVSRAPIAGAVLTLQRAGAATSLPAACFDDVAQQGQVTLADGYYRFDLNFSDAACPSGGDYLVVATAPTTSYVAGYSQIIPPTSGPATAPLAVPSCPGSADDAVPATTQHCEAQSSEFAPSASVPARSAGTRYHVHLRLDGSQSPGSSQAFNNHVPLDPELSGALAISKTTPLMNVTRGQLVPYTITVNNVAGLALTDVAIVDRYPAGFTYVEGSARLDGVATEPSLGGRELRWSGLAMAGASQHTVQLLLAVGAGVSEGEYVNRAQVVHDLTGNAVSGEATATVRVMPDPTFDCTDVTGKVFDDANRNGVQDDGERGIAGVRLATTNGLLATTDAHGRYHITCAATPDEARGSNFVLKLDDRTLPSGFRMSTPQVQVKRATRGKALKLNFGASIYRVVGLDLADDVFEPGTTTMRVQWRPRLELLLAELRKAPAVLRLSYVADLEDATLVDQRMVALTKQVTDAWEAMNCCYALTIEPEVFWRLGGPPDQPVVRAPEGR